MDCCPNPKFLGRVGIFPESDPYLKFFFFLKKKKTNLIRGYRPATFLVFFFFFFITFFLRQRDFEHWKNEIFLTHSFKMKQWISWHQSEQNNISCGVLTLQTMTQLSMVDVQEAIEQLNIGKKQLQSRWYWYRYGSLFSLHSRMYSQFLLERRADTCWSNVAKINFVYEYLRRLFSAAGKVHMNILIAWG